MDWVQAFTLIIGGSGLTGAILAVVTEISRRRNEKQTYWRRERQLAFAVSVNLYHQLAGTNARLIALAAMRPEREDEYKESLENAKALRMEFEKSRGMIDLIATKTTRDKANDFARAAVEFHVMIGRERDSNVIISASQEVFAAGMQMLQAFRAELVGRR
jgi:hypothetical protein